MTTRKYLFMIRSDEWDNRVVKITEYSAHYRAK